MLLFAARGLEECTLLRNVGDPKNLYYHAGACFEAAGEIYQAAQSFARAERYERAVELLFNANDYDHGIEFLLDYRKGLNAELYARLLDTGRHHLFTRREYGYVF